ncbi:hypothetical protein [Actinokineospora iranica]|uniref:Uncharacterized protein n=1 Tax=Actinokineospora iranica TaxID=1271860 RepID=A0A1G6KKE5_9PSEU|nr:hypothetical protein [Actinokineospora iranica]SDC31572.1 hypothetical protein SAMN05216174_101966 [Actinokineospora iranica]
MKTLGKLTLAAAIAIAGLGVAETALPVAQAEAAMSPSAETSLRDAGATIVLRVTNITEVITLNTIHIQQFLDGGWTEPDFATQSTMLYPEPGWDYEDTYWLKGPGGEIPSAGTYRFKVVTTDENGVELGTVHSQRFTTH